MSTKSGKKPAQKHQNTFAFIPSTHNPHKLKISEIPIEFCCAKCVAVLKYKQQFGKYKPLTQPKTCNECHRRTIKRAYHTLCEECKGVRCAKCRVEMEVEVESEEEIDEDISHLKERERRSYQRKMEKGDIEGAQKILERNEEF